MSITEPVDNTTRQYMFPKSMLITAAVVYLILAALILAGAVLAFLNIKESPANIIASACICLPALGLFFLVRHYFHIMKSVIEVTPAGISRLETDGKNTVFTWDEIGRLEERGFQQQLAIYGKTGKKRLLVDYQFEDFDGIRKRVFDEIEKRLAITYPAAFGKFGMTFESYNWIILAVVAVIILPILLSEKKLSQDGLLILAACTILPLVLLYLIGQFWPIKQVVIDGGGFTFRRIIGEMQVRYSDILFLEYKYISPNYNYSLEGYLIKKSGGGMKQPVVEIMLTNGKVHKLERGPVPLPETYICLKKASGKGPMKITKGMMSNLGITGKLNGTI